MKLPFQDAVDRHGATVLRVCRAVLGNDPEAEDAWSETFVAALKAWPELPEDTNVQAWLVRVAQRKAIDVTRSRARSAVPTDTAPEVPADSGNPDADGHALWAAVAALPTKQRLAVAYHYLGGLSHAETAALTGSTVAAVRRASADGVKALRLTMARDDVENAAHPGNTTPENTTRATRRRETRREETGHDHA